MLQLVLLILKPLLLRLLLRGCESMTGGRRAVAERPVVNVFLLLISGSEVDVLWSSL